jgi:hypothetical protein
MLKVVQSQEAGLEWLRMHDHDFFCSIKFWRKCDMKWAVKVIRWFWESRFRYDEKTFSGPIQQWLFILKDPKRFGGVYLFTVIRGVPHKYRDLLRDLLHEQIGPTKVLFITEAKMKAISDRLVTCYEEGILIDYEPLALKMPYSDYPIKVNDDGYGFYFKRNAFQKRKR